MTYSVRNIVIAVVLAVLAAVLVIIYTSNAQKQATQGQQTMKVLVASSEIPAGTTVKQASDAGDFTVRQIVTKDVVPGALNSTATLSPSFASTSTITVGSQVTASMFAESNANPIITQIKGVDRAMQLSLNPNMVMGGTLKAGDHVDILWTDTIQPTDADSKFGDEDISKVLFLDVPVLSTYDTGSGSAALAADGQSPSSGGSINGQSGIGVIVQLSQTQTAQMLLAMNTGTIWFALRADGKKATDQPVVINTACTLVGAGLTAAQLKRVVPGCIAGGGK